MTPSAKNKPFDFFSEDTVEDVYITISETDWNSLLAGFLLEEYHSASITYRNITLDEVAFRTKGNSSLQAVADMNGTRFSELLSKPFGGSRPPLFQSLVCSYVRIALTDEKNGERLTLDINLSFNDPNHMRIKQLNQVLIAEVKRENRKAPSVFIDIMDRFRQKPVSFSKYCIGCALLHSERIKTNRFKATLSRT